MENKITSKMVIEAMEQVRAGFTVSRIALGACTLLYPLKKLDQKWGKKFEKVQSEYHKFLLDTYSAFEKELPKLEQNEKNETKETESVENTLPQSVLDELINTPYTPDTKITE